MGTKIDKILNKKGWTGAEVGKVLIACLVHDLENRGQDKEPLFNEEDFRKMENSLDSVQWKTYGCYSSLYSCLIDMTNISQGQFQQLFHGYYRCYSQVETVIASESACISMMNRPVIVTDTQYDRLKQQATDRLRAFDTNYSYMIRDICYRFLNHPDEAPKEVQKELEACKKELVTNKRILDNYNIDTDKGYYVYADGTRSDVEGKPKAEGKPDILELSRIAFGDAEDLAEIYKEKTGNEISLKAAELALAWIKGAMDGLEEEDLVELDDDAARIVNLIVSGRREEFKCDFHFYDAPNDLDKYTAIFDNIDRYFGQYDLRYDAEADDDLEEISEEEQFKEFKADYPKLYKALHEYLVSVFPKADKLTGTKQFKTITTWGELADLGITSFVSATTPDQYDILEEYEKESTCTDELKERAEKNGIAVMPAADEKHIDEDGNYKEEPIDGVFRHFLEVADMDCEDINNVRTEGAWRTFATKLLIPSICFLYAYHALLDILISVYSVPEVSIIKDMLCMDEVEEKISNLNGLIYLLYQRVGGTREEKARKRATIQNRYMIIDIEKCKPSEEAIEDVREQIEARFKRRETFDPVFHLTPFINKLKARGYEDE